MTVINLSGEKIYFNAAVQNMDTEICEKLNNELAPCSEQEFFTAYEKAHQEVFGEPWFLSEYNPVY